MGKIVYVKDINGNIVETELRDERGERIKQLEEENRKLKEENEIIMRNADGIAHHNVELMKKVKELEKKLGIE